MLITKFRICAVIPIFTAGCAAAELDELDPDLEVGAGTRAIDTMNGLTWPSQHSELEHLMFNALATNGPASDALIQVPLADATFTSGHPDADPFLIEQLHDPYARTLMRYIVSCALASGDTVTLTAADLPSITWSGELGLCPAWSAGPASTDCQERVSACVAARVNAFGQQVSISLRGMRDATQSLPMRTSPFMEADFYTWQEGAFWGDLFGASAHDPDVSVRVDAGDIVYEFRTPALHELSYPLAQRDLAHTDFLSASAYQGTVYPGLHACWSPIWQTGLAYAHRRACAGPTGERCAATPAGNCGQPMNLASHPAGYPIEVCMFDAAQTFYTSCAAGTWPLTVYLHEPCDIVDRHCRVVRHPVHGPGGHR